MLKIGSHVSFVEYNILYTVNYIHHYIFNVNMPSVYHYLPFNRLLCGKYGLCKDQAKVTVNSRNSSCTKPVKCRGGLIYSGNFIKPVHCFHPSKRM